MDRHTSYMGANYSINYTMGRQVRKIIVTYSISLNISLGYHSAQESGVDLTKVVVDLGPTDFSPSHVLNHLMAWPSVLHLIFLVLLKSKIQKLD